MFVHWGLSAKATHLWQVVGRLPHDAWTLVLTPSLGETHQNPSSWRLLKVPLESVLRLGLLVWKYSPGLEEDKGNIQVRALQGMETHPKLAELDRGFVNSRVEKSRFFPNLGSLDTPSLQTCLPLLALALGHCPRADPLHLPGERRLLWPRGPSQKSWSLGPVPQNPGV